MPLVCEPYSAFQRRRGSAAVGIPDAYRRVININEVYIQQICKLICIYDWVLVCVNRIGKYRQCFQEMCVCVVCVCKRFVSTFVLRIRMMCEQRTLWYGCVGVMFFVVFVFFLSQSRRFYNIQHKRNWTNILINSYFSIAVLRDVLWP